MKIALLFNCDYPRVEVSATCEDMDLDKLARAQRQLKTAETWLKLELEYVQRADTKKAPRK